MLDDPRRDDAHDFGRDLLAVHQRTRHLDTAAERRRPRQPVRRPRRRPDSSRPPSVAASVPTGWCASQALRAATRSLTASASGCAQSRSNVIAAARSSSSAAFRSPRASRASPRSATVRAVSSGISASRQSVAAGPRSATAASGWPSASAVAPRGQAGGTQRRGTEPFPDRDQLGCGGPGGEDVATRQGDFCSRRQQTGSPERVERRVGKGRNRLVRGISRMRATSAEVVLSSPQHPTGPGVSIWRPRTQRRQGG
jgi:hypothetical protein